MALVLKSEFIRDLFDGKVASDQQPLRFRHISQKAGISSHIGNGMAAVVADYDQDGYPVWSGNSKVSLAVKLA